MPQNEECLAKDETSEMVPDRSHEIQVPSHFPMQRTHLSDMSEVTFIKDLLWLGIELTTSHVLVQLAISTSLRSIVFSSSFYKGGNGGTEQFSNSPTSTELFTSCLCNQDTYSPVSRYNFDFCSSLAKTGEKKPSGEAAVADETLFGASPSLRNPQVTQAPSSSRMRLCIPRQGRPLLGQSARAQMTSSLNESDSQAHEYVCKKTTQHLNLTPRKFNFTWGAISLWPLLPCPDVSLI